MNQTKLLGISFKKFLREIFTFRGIPYPASLESQEWPEAGQKGPD